MKKTHSLKTEHKGVSLQEWIEVPNPTTHESHVRFRLYHTGKQFALSTMHGYGGMSESVMNMPKSWTSGTKDYRKTEEGIIGVLERKIKARGIEMEEE